MTATPYNDAWSRSLSQVELSPEFRRTRWICAQIGAREHYAVPATLQAVGRLRRLFTDYWMGPWGQRIDRGPRGLRSLAARRHPLIPGSKVVSFSARFMWSELYWRWLKLLGRPMANDQKYLSVGRLFSEAVNRSLARCDLDPQVDRFFGYNTGSLETLAYLAERQIPTVLDQIDAGRVGWELIQAESEKWPGWSLTSNQLPQSYFDRIAAEWKLADRVVVNSAWSQEALIRQGVPANKIVVVPLTYDAPNDLVRTRHNPKGPLVVLWVGSVVLGKGIQYLIEAARRLPADRFQFDVAGTIGISEHGLRQAPANVRFLGPVPRQEIAKLYLNSDVYVLPTVSDGFALTQLEALAYGVPVIVTPNCARIVEHGVEGLIIPAGESAALVEALATCEANRERLVDMSQAALLKAGQFSATRWLNDLQTNLGDLGYARPS
jgi:glycosyltransferase involved in cell wall biosynthesis